jgi:hypothetical protein
MCLSKRAVTTRLVSFLICVAALVGCGNAEDEREPVWGYISPAIVQPNCATASCHSKGAATAGLDLSTAENGYISLLQLKLAPRGVTPAGGTPNEPPRQLVLPFNPDESRMVNMLWARGAHRMPPDRPLASADIRLIEKWILNGAENK